MPCLTDKLQSFVRTAQVVNVKPIDPAQYLDFTVKEIRDEIVTFYKRSNMQDVEVPLRAIRDISAAVNGEPAIITLRGRLRWREDIQRWRFSTE